jgi:hypothetical protein
MLFFSSCTDQSYFPSDDNLANISLLNDKQQAMGDDPILNPGGTACGPLPAGCNQSTYFEGDTLIVLNDSCTVRATWKEIICYSLNPNGGFTYSFVFTDFMAMPLPGNCEDITDWEQFQRDVSILLEEMRVSDWLNVNEPDPASTTFKCNGGNKFLYTEFNMETCRQWWVSFEVTPPLVSTSCGTACCRRTTRYCVQKDIH